MGWIFELGSEIEEFTDPTKTERAVTARKVHEFFDNTIERRDGYYVGITFKENWTSLPNNYKCAQKRLLNL